MTAIIRSVLAALVVSGTLAAQAPSRGTLVTRIDSIVNAALAAPFSSFSVAVVKGRDTLTMKAYGSANIELGVRRHAGHRLQNWIADEAVHVVAW